MKNQSVLASLRPMIEAWLQFNRKNKTGAKNILNTRLKAPNLNQWSAAISPTGSNRSHMLWKWRLARSYAPHNTSTEKLLEKSVANHLSEDEWANQMATASGLSHNSGDRGRKIDLVNKTGPASFRFIELKTGKTENPVSAAVELLEYGLLYWWARQNPQIRKSGREDTALFSADHIVMEVLAPSEFYHGFDKPALKQFGEMLTEALHQLSRGQPKLEFVFAILDLPLDPASWNKETLKTALENPRRL